MGLHTYQRQILEGKLRLPILQPLTPLIASSLKSSMMTADALRRGGTSRSGIATGPLPPVQQFTVPPGELWPNAPASMAPGFRRAGNYKAGVGQGRGQSAGV
jgi:hypothetical protein